MKTVIVYKSFMGATRQYAEWLKEFIETDIFRYEQVGDGLLRNYDRIIVMSGTYAGKMPLTRFLQDNWEILKNKNIIAIASGGQYPDQKESNESFLTIPEEIRKKIKYFKVIGKFFVFPKGGLKKENLEEVIEFLKK